MSQAIKFLVIYEYISVFEVENFHPNTILKKQVISNLGPMFFGMLWAKTGTFIMLH